MLQETLEKIMETYAAARTEPMADHPIARLVDLDLPAAVRSLMDRPDDYVVDASASKGNWADGPWAAIMDPAITESTQRGYYVVFLFSRSLSNVYLSLNQGVTELKIELGLDGARTQLRSRAALIVSRLGTAIGPRMSPDPIDLEPRRSGSLLELYQHGHALGRRFAKGRIPPDSELAEDLRMILRIYQRTRASGGVTEIEDPPVPHHRSARTGTKADEALIERRRYSAHGMIERNQSLARRAKEYHGYRCQVCEFSFEEQYGELGAGYIEAHHRTPLALLPDDAPVSLSPRDDFVVVCANCHRMIHRPGAPDGFEEFRQLFRSLNPPDGRTTQL